MRYLQHAIAASVFLAPGHPVSAITVAPGETAFLPGTTLLETPALAGSLAASQSTLFDLNETPLFIQGWTVDSEIRRSDADSATIMRHRFAQATNTFPSFAFVDSYRIFGYAGLVADVYFRFDGPGDRAPTSVRRSDDGDMLEFTFGFPLVAGYLLGQVQETSFAIDILTNADSFTTSGEMAVYGRLQEEASTVERNVLQRDMLVPVIADRTGGPGSDVAAVPLPSPAGLLSMALLGLAALRQTRRMLLPFQALIAATGVGTRMTNRTAAMRVRGQRQN